MPTKSIFKSKTFWVAIFQAFLGCVVIFSTTYPEVGGLVVAKSIIDVILRLITDTPASI